MAASTPRVDQWLAHIDAAEPVAEERRAQLAADDLTRRRNVAERDPAKRERTDGQPATRHHRPA